MNRKFFGRTVCLFLTVFLAMPSDEKQSVPFICGVETLLSSSSASFSAMMHLHLLPKKMFLKYCLIIDSLHSSGPEPDTFPGSERKVFSAGTVSGSDLLSGTAGGQKSDVRKKCGTCTGSIRNQIHRIID